MTHSPIEIPFPQISHSPWEQKPSPLSVCDLHQELDSTCVEAWILSWVHEKTTNHPRF